MIVQGIYFYWRYKTYGDFLPNTYYAKVGSPPDQIRRGFTYLGDYFINFGGIIWLVFILFAWRALKGRIITRIFLFGTTFLFLAIIIYVGGDALPMYRFLVPVIPLLSALLALGIAEVFTALHHHDKLAQEKQCSFFPCLSTGLILIAITGYGTLPAYVGRQSLYVQADRERMQDRILIGKWLKEHHPGKTIALNAAGAIPFYSELNTIDMLGLNDKHIAHKQITDRGAQVSGHEKYDEEYVLSKRPDIIFIGRNELTLEPKGVFVWLKGDEKLMHHPILRRDYQPVTLPVGGGMEYFTFYLRKDHL